MIYTGSTIPPTPAHESSRRAPRRGGLRAAARRNSGFTLVELMIVVAIIAIIAAVAIPSLQESRKSAVEAKAISLMRTFITVEEQYRTRFGAYPSDPSELWNRGYIIDVDTGSYLEEYDGNYQATSTTWFLQLDPDDPGVSADRYFYADQTGVIRVSLSGPATSTSDPLH